MKKTKFAVLLTALVAMLGLSSCFGDPDPYVTNVSIMKVSGYPPYVTFEDAYGTKLIPTNQSLFITSGIDSDYSYVQYKYDSREVDVNSKELSAEVLAYVPLNEIDYSYDGSVMESNAPMYENTSVDYRSQVSIFDRNIMLVNISYYYKKKSGDDLSTELNKHSFYLAEEKAEEGATVDENTINLCLIHHVVDPEINDERTKICSETRYFDLRSILQGRVPETIKIKYKVLKSGSSEDMELVDANNPLELNYKELVET